MAEPLIFFFFFFSIFKKAYKIKHNSDYFRIFIWKYFSVRYILQKNS